MNSAIDAIRTQFTMRPWWMNLLMLFCAYMALIYVPWDFLVKDIRADQEVWFGIRLYGLWAKLTEPVHFLIYAAGTWGFFRMRSWMWPWAALYAAQVSISMMVWALLYARPERGLQAALISGGISAALTGAIAVALYMARDRFRHT